MNQTAVRSTAQDEAELTTESAVAALSELAPATDKSIINADSLYKQLTLHETLIVTCLESAVENIKKKLTKKKYDINKKLGKFADNSHRLSYEIIHRWEVEPVEDNDPKIKKCKLRITLAAKIAAPLEGIEEIETATALIVPDEESLNTGFENSDDIGLS